MTNKLNANNILIYIYLLLLCLIFTSCSVNSKIKPQEPLSSIEATNKSTPIPVQSPRKTEGNKDKKVIESWEEYEASEKPLISAIKEKGIYLYGKKEGGVVLEVGDSVHEYEWGYITPRFILPRMYATDFDNDEKDELAVLCYIGSGTGVSVGDLHIVEISETGTISDKPNPEYFKDYLFDDYVSQLNKEVDFETFYNKGELMGKITADNKTYTLSLKDYQAKEYGKINDDLSWGNIVRFNCENNKLMVEFGVGITSKLFAAPFFIGNLSADVVYSAGKFKMKNLRFQENQN